MLKENDFKSIIEKQEAFILEQIKTLPKEHQKFMLQSWVEVKNKRLTGEQFTKNLKDYINADSDTNNRT